MKQWTTGSDNGFSKQWTEYLDETTDEWNSMNKTSTNEWDNGQLTNGWTTRWQQ